MSAPRKAVCILGPTGAGKTDAGVFLARELGGEVVNFDSRQVYAGLAIVTAQPDAAEQGGVPHHLYGFLSPCQPLSAARYAELAHEAVAAIAARGRLPILVGGTGMYLRALLAGLADIPPVPDAVRGRITAQCAELGPEALHARLAQADPTFAARVHPRDRQRVIRGLEVLEATGRPLSAWHAEQGRDAPRLSALHLGLTLDRGVLAERLAVRIERMLAAGALAEAAAAYAACPDESAPGFTGIGCRELIALHLGRMGRDEALGLWLKRTRDYAKRQLTWFRHQTPARWFDPADHAGLLEAAAAFVHSAS